MHLRVPDLVQIFPGLSIEIDPYEEPIDSDEEEFHVRSRVKLLDQITCKIAG